jgi:hypothetical protein
MQAETNKETQRWSTPRLSRYGTFAEATQQQQVKTRGRGDQFIPDVLTPFFSLS